MPGLAVLMDADSGRILFDKNGEENWPMRAPRRSSPASWPWKKAEAEQEVVFSRRR
ncbi:MAG: hypothetical protein ACLR2E_06775 [Lachnospiraceae bacterium]